MRRTILLSLLLGTAVPAWSDLDTPPDVVKVPSDEPPVEPESRCRAKFFGQRDINCAASALADLLLTRFNQDVGPEEIFAELWSHADEDSQRLGFSLLDLKKFLERHDFQGDGYNISLAELGREGASALAIVNVDGNSHFIVVRGFRDGQVLINDPGFGLVKISERRFHDIWRDGVLFVIRDRENPRAPDPGAPAAWNTAAPEADYLPTAVPRKSP